jgi:predicted tellurium resistance membrane protein TerC
LAGGVFASAQNLTTKLMAQMQTNRLVKVKVFTALFGVGLNIISANLYGIDGVVYSGVIYSLIYFACVAKLVMIKPEYR